MNSVEKMSEDFDIDKIKELVGKSSMPEELKEKIINGLPDVMENVNEMARTVYDPNKVWLEAIQYADYVQQHTEHIQQGHEGCREEVVDALLNMTKEFKRMAEHAMIVLDTLQVEANLIDFNKVKLTVKKRGKDATQ